MPKQQHRYRDDAVYEPGLSTLLSWPLLSVIATAVHIFVRSAILHSPLRSAETGVVLATGIMSTLLCIWLDVLGKKDPKAGDVARSYKFWGFAQVVIAIGVSLCVHYGQVAVEKRAAMLRAGVSENVKNIDTAMDKYLIDRKNHDSCLERFAKLRKKAQGDTQVIDLCGKAPIAPSRDLANVDSTAGAADWILYEVLALALLAVICITDVLTYGHGLMRVSGIAESAYKRSKERLPPQTTFLTSLPDPPEGID